MCGVILGALVVAWASWACTLSTSCTNGKITTVSLPDAIVGQAYSIQLTQSCGGNDAASWQLLDDKGPPGLALSWDGRLFGTPTAPGQFAVDVQVNLTSRGQAGTIYPAGSDSRTYTLTVRPQG